MRILFTTGHVYLPQRGGGVLSNTDQLAKALQSYGHTVAVACKLAPGGWLDKRSRIARRLSGSRFSRDRALGYPVYRAWDPTDLGDAVHHFKPDIAVVQNGDTFKMAKSLEPHDVPSLVYFHNVDFCELVGHPDDLALSMFVANSRFTACRAREVYGIDCDVVRPFVDAQLYRTVSSRENITFINPYPQKGLDIAFAVAEGCPDIPFVFVESWPLGDELRRSIQERMRQNRNIILLDHTVDMRSVYAKARILLVPSVCEEAWGRVATEAHTCSIPVVGSNQGGLPEAIGAGGVILDIKSEVSEWTTTVRRLWDDTNAYKSLSVAAGSYSLREEIQPTFQRDRMLDLLSTAILR